MTKADGTPDMEPTFSWTQKNVYDNANDNIYDGALYFTQEQRWDESFALAQAEAKKDGGIIEWTAKRYEDWETMHDPNVMWFDTAACLDGGHIGNVNAISFQPTTERFSRRTRID